jgi:predicted GNAT superfamily acetyltransferase
MEFRTLTSPDEFRQVYDLELEIWGEESAGDRVPVLMLLVSTRIGGLCIGAFDERRLAGFVYALPGIREGQPFQWSHMMGVRPEYRSAGLGARLKLEQRRLAMASGVDLIAWTYDPLQAANAHLNVARLGAVASEYHLDAYPGSASPLHAGTATDRLVADWWLRSARVRERLQATGRSESALVHDIMPVNRVRDAGEWLAPDGHDLEADAPNLALVIPTGFTEMQQQDLALARDWRAVTREIFVDCFRRGYAVTDFVLDRPRCRGTYVLSKA